MTQNTAPAPSKTECRSGPCSCPGEKACKWCEVVKPLPEYQRHRRMADGHINVCKTCRNAYVRSYHASNPEKISEYRRRSIETRQWRRDNVPGYKQDEKRSANRDKASLARASRKHLLKKKYGLTLEAFDALVAAQDNCCAICQADQGEVRMHVDHCHATGKVRGLLCSPCNTALGLFKDNPPALRRAAAYIERTV